MIGDSDNMRVRYVKAMENFDQYGRALWRMPLNSRMHVGQIGYFDVDREWKELCVITDPESIAGSELDKIQPLTQKVTQTVDFLKDGRGPMNSSNVVSSSPSLDLGAT